MMRANLAPAVWMAQPRGDFPLSDKPSYSEEVSLKVSLASKVLQDRTPEEVIALAGALGFGGIEWFCLPQHLPADISADRLDDLARRTRDAGLATVCLSTYVGGFAESDDTQAAAQITLLDRYLDIAATLNCPVLRIWPDLLGRTVREPVSDAVLGRTADWLRASADRAAAAGRTLAIEMHLTIGADVDLLMRLFAMIDRPNVGAIYDAGNLFLARLPYGPETIHRLGERILHVQVKDASRSRPTPPHLQNEPTLRMGGDFELLLGEGEIDFPPLFSALRNVGYQGWYSVECHAPPRPGLDSSSIAAAELNTLRELLEG